MGAAPAEQIIAGVVLSERLAVTMYGAIHRAQWNDQRNLRGLIVDPQMLAQAGFRDALTDTAGIDGAIRLAHANIVPTVAVEAEGPDVVVVTRGGGRYVTVQDLIASARTSRGAGKLQLHIAGAIGKAVVEALAVAHRAGLVHGAVHPRSVLIDEDGSVRITDFVVGRALTTAVAAGADGALWRGLAGYVSPELVVGEHPTPAADVYAVGALLFTMLAGELPPGSLRATPAVERLVQRALDTDVSRRYPNAQVLLENLDEAFEDDRWELADRGELIRAAGLSSSDTNIDDATEDLLASLGKSGGDVQTPIRPSVDLRAEAASARHKKVPTAVAPGQRLDALLAHLEEDHSDEHSGVTAVEPKPFKRDPISELIAVDPRAREAIVTPSLRRTYDDSSLDDQTPLPPPTRDSDMDLRGAPSRRSISHDEASALDALSDLDEPVRRVSTAAEAAHAAALRLEAAASRAEAAVATVPSAPRALPISPDVVGDLVPPSMNVRGSGRYVVAALAVIALGVGIFVLYHIYASRLDDIAAAKAQHDKDQQAADERTQAAIAGLADPGALEIRSTPSEAGVWLRLGPTPAKTGDLQAGVSHEFGLVMPGFDETERQVIAADWSAPTSGDQTRTATALAILAAHDATKKPPAKTELPQQPIAEQKQTGVSGHGVITITSQPAGAEAWLFIGVTNNVRYNNVIAGRPYELVVVKDGFAPAHIAVAADDWRDNDPNTPIDSAKKKAVISRDVELTALPKKLR